MNTKKNRSFSAFTTNIVLVVLVLIGIALIPKITIKLNPTKSLPTLYISYNYANATPEIVEKQVTAKLEGVLSTINGLSDITSQSGEGWGQIDLKIDKNSDLQSIRFEVLGLLRQIYPELPEQVSYPRISKGTRDESKQIRLMTYTLNSPDDSYKMLKYVQNNIEPRLANLDKISKIDIFGSSPYEWKIDIDKPKITNLNINFSDIYSSVSNYFTNNDLGKAYVSQSASNEMCFVKLFGNSNTKPDLSIIPIKNISGRIIHLKDIANINYTQQAPTSYYRINGQTALNIVLYATEDANQLKLANSVFDIVTQITNNLPQHYSLIKTYDSTEYLKKELNKTGIRTIFSVAILLIFVLFINRSFRYLLLIIISLLANIIIAFILYYFLKIEIHLYSLAGITVSFGIVIDNTIVMMDHLRNKKNKQVFLAILAATLTTIGALTVIFFLSDEQKVNLIDFALVIIINLTVSVFTALFFIPALMEKIKIKKNTGAFVIRRKRRIISFNKAYKGLILFTLRWRKTLFFVLLLTFGLPIIFLPNSIQGNNWFKGVYNKTIGSETYQIEYKPIIDKIFGGTLRLFVETIIDEDSFAEPARTSLNVTVELQEGGTLDQLNEIFLSFEKFLKEFNEIDQFHAQINNNRYGRITIYFKPEYDYSGFPYELKSYLEAKAIGFSSADFGVHGVGKSFNNSLNNIHKENRLIFSGYNYNQLLKYVNQAKDSLLKNPRIQEIEIVSGNSWGSSQEKALAIDIDKNELIKYNGSLINFASLLQQEGLNYLGNQYVNFDNQLQNISFSYSNSKNIDFWNINNSVLKTGSQQSLKPIQVGKLIATKTDNLIYKKNQQYLITLAYDFIGPQKFAKKILTQNQDEINKSLPLGYKTYQSTEPNYWDLKESAQYFLIFIMLAIIYFVCAILLESLIQPFIIIATIPISFIGVFLTFYLFDFGFDQGGYASFLLLSGLVVNSALYLINDLNNLERTKPTIPRLQLYIKAYNSKIIPIALTIMSTILGLIPFLFFGKHEPFWFALAAGTTGGLLFSVIAIVFVLPIMFKRMK